MRRTLTIASLERSCYALTNFTQVVNIRSRHALNTASDSH